MILDLSDLEARQENNAALRALIDKKEFSSTALPPAGVSYHSPSEDEVAAVEAVSVERGYRPFVAYGRGIR